MIFPVLGVVILNRFFISSLLGHDASFPAHGFVLQIELCVLNPVVSLLLSLAHKDLRQDIFENKHYGLITSFLAWLELLLLDFKFGPRFDFLLFRFLSEGSTEIRFVVIWIFPKLPVEHVPLLLDSPLLPVLRDYVVDYLLVDTSQSFIRVLVEPLCNLSGLGVLVHKSNFLEAIDNPFKVFFAYHTQLRLEFEVLSVFDRQFIILVLEVKCAVIH